MTIHRYLIKYVVLTIYTYCVYVFYIEIHSFIQTSNSFLKYAVHMDVKCKVQEHIMLQICAHCGVHKYRSKMYLPSYPSTKIAINSKYSFHHKLKCFQMIIHHDPFTKFQKKPQMNRLYYLAVLANNCQFTASVAI